MDQSRVTVSLHYHLVVTKLLGNVTGRGSRHFNPSLTEKSTSGKDEGQVENSMERIVDDLGERRGRRNVVSDSTDGDLLPSAAFCVLPLSEKTNQNIGWSSVVQKLGNKVQVGNQSSLKDDGHVGSVEKLDGVVSLLSSVLLVLDGKINTPSLEINDNNKDQNSCQKVGQVGKILAVKSLAKRADLIVTGDEKVEKRNDSSLELGTATSINGGGAEGLPDDVFTNVGGDKERNTRSKSISLLEELVKGKHNQTSAKKLGNDQKSISSTDGSEVSVHSTDNVGDGFTGSDQNTKELLGTSKQSTIFLDIVINLDDARTSEKLHDKTRSNDRTDSKLHESTTVGGQNNTHPVERIGGLGTLDTINGDLTANQENEKSDGGP
mmetsp:Transcript_66406/g.185620  ORF Transcript_66406/g.185620 Transcript_66406/m.185620 type:complete len:379 (+) Transcript_66406:578-1714(+)